jgi:hypothetical protein
MYALVPSYVIGGVFGVLVLLVVLVIGVALWQGRGGV